MEKENIILWVDDLRNPAEPVWNKYIKSIFNGDLSVIWVKSYKEFYDYVFNNGKIPAYISFDHDLGINDDGSEYTGYDCAKVLVDLLVEYYLDCNQEVMPEINVHSSNPAGKENIEGLFKSFKKYIGKQ